MDKQFTDLLEAYRSGTITRRELMSRGAAVAGGYALMHHWLEASGAAATLLSQRESAAANVESSTVQYASLGDQVDGYLSRPRRSGKLPAVIVIHENRGLNEHTRDVARRFAAEGFVALAPDALSRRGGTGSMENPDKARDVIGTLSQQEVMADLNGAFDFLAARADVDTRRISSVGFCWGGARSFLLATANPKLHRAVVFYGSTPAPEVIARIHAPVLGIYGEKDERITSKVTETAELMKKAGKKFEYKIYPGADHAFFNDTSAARYNAEAARDAWTVALKFLRS